MTSGIVDLFQEFLLFFVPDWPCIPDNIKRNRNGTVNIFLGFFFMVNFVLGTGFLGIPSGFFHGGLLAGIVTLLIVAFMAWLCALYEVEAMARAQAIWEFRNTSQDNGNDSLSSENSNVKPKFYISMDRKFEPSEMCHVFVGFWLKVVYLIIFIIYSFLATLSYSTVIGSAWSVNLPLNFGALEECTDTDFLHHILPGGGCLNAYRFCIFLFAVIVVPISLLDLKEQAIIQLLLGVLRFVTLGAIILYSFVHLVGGQPIDHCNITSTEESFNLNDTSLSSIRHIVFHFDPKSWTVGIPIYVYAFILHQGIPGLTHPIKEKRLLRGYFNTLFLVVTAFYVVLGVVVSLWFRDCVNETCTLNWDPLTSSSHQMALRVLSYYIILFPSIDVCSVFPLMIHTIVNNIYTVFGQDTSQMKGWKHKLIQLLMKFIGSILPIGIGMFVSNLVYVLKYAGLLGFFISLFFPMIFQFSSQWVCFRTFVFSEKTKGMTTNAGSPVSVQEKTLLLPAENKSTITWKSALPEFFTLRKNSLYWTPYSIPLLSSPLFVFPLFMLATCCFSLTIYSLTVHISN